MSDVRPGMVIEWRGAPCEVLSYEFSKKQRQKPVVRIKLKNLKGGGTTDQTFQSGDKILQIELERRKAVFLYENRGVCWFYKDGDKSARFEIPIDVVGSVAQYLKGEGRVTLLVWNGNIIGVHIPIKVDIRVAEAPPNVRGNTSQGGTKTVTLETGAKVMTPLFVEVGDIIRVNTETNEYVERVTKG